MQLIEINIITGTKDLATGVWPTQRHYVKTDSIEIVHEYMETYDKNTCQVLLNTKMPAMQKPDKPVGTSVAYFALRESMDSFVERLKSDEKVIPLPTES